MNDLKHFVYRNLHKDCWSLRDEKTKRVERNWANYVELRNAEFKVSEAGRQRVLREKRKNVHAGVKGHIRERYGSNVSITDHDIAYFRKLEASPEYHEVYYNPYKCSTFMAGDTPVLKAKTAILFKDGDRFRILASGIE